MERQDDRDEQIHGMFRSARQADEAEAPSFRTLVGAAPRRASAWPAPGRALRIAFMTTAGSVMVVLGATWLVVREPARTFGPPSPPRIAREVEPESSLRTQSLLPPVEHAILKDATAPTEKPTRAPTDSPPPPAFVSALMAQLDNEREHVTSENEDLPVPGRFYQNVLTLASGVKGADGDGNPDVHGNQFASRVNPNSIENMERITGGAGVAYRNALGGGSALPAGEALAEAVPSTESYRPIQENDFRSVIENPLSTFSIDVDTASYANVRRLLGRGRLPPPDAVRIEELVNYFRYDYPPATGDAPFSASIEVAGCPWSPAHRLVRIGLKGREAGRGDNAGSNLVFLLDVSGSMDHPAKLPLVRAALALLVEQLDGRDRVAIVVYAGASGLVLPPTPGSARGEIRAALDQLRAGGSTNGGAGLELAYRLARENFIPGGINRVILATDGDFNVGVTSQGELLRLIEDDARRGVFLTVLGFGMGNYKDDTLELLADRGNGNYAYIDDLREARKVLVEEVGGTLATIAKDVKIQVEFNPAAVGAWRLIGYENRLLSKEDFNDDRKDAGEIGAGHTVTALYELVLPGHTESAAPAVDPLKYQARGAVTSAAESGELLTLKLRYKEPDGDTSRLLAFPVADDGRALDDASADFKFASAVAGFGMILRGSPHKADLTLDRVRELALAGLGPDEGGYRREFVELVRHAEGAATRTP